jgi:hypothetical protein
VRDILYTTADNVGSWVTKGRVNAQKAVDKAAPFLAFSSRALSANVGVNGGVAEGTLLTPFGSVEQAGNSVQAIDTSLFSVRAKSFEKLGFVASVDTLVKVTPPINLIRSATVEVTASGPSPASMLVFIYNFASGSWEQVGSSGMSMVEKTSSYSIPTTNIARYLNSSGHMRVYVRALQSSRVKGGEFTLSANKIGINGLYDPTAAP